MRRVDLTLPMIDRAMADGPWTYGNEILYRMCRESPDHTNVPEVIAKVWLIGRSYAAAIERRKIRFESGDAFYVDKVGPGLVASDIDRWLADARQCDPTLDASLATLLEAHWRLTGLFSALSGLEKRSLASKYLHFHVPALFYIYDSRAVAAMRRLTRVVGTVLHDYRPSDPDYAAFATKCRCLARHVHDEYGRQLTPRQLDTLLLEISSESN